MEILSLMVSKTKKESIYDLHTEKQQISRSNFLERMSFSSNETFYIHSYLTLTCFVITETH